MYKMRGCNKNTRRKRSKRSNGGGDLGLAYPNNNMYKGPNSNLAYTGTGAGSGKNAAYPNEGVKASDGRLDFINPSGLQHGGDANGMVATPWTPNVNGWPGVNNTTGSGNYYVQNKFNQGDPQTSMKDVGANPPYTYLVGKSRTKKRKQRGGTLSNFFAQDLVNLGRQVQFNMGSAYNALAGYNAPVNPLPWKDQMPHLPNTNTLKSLYR